MKIPCRIECETYTFTGNNYTIFISHENKSSSFPPNGGCRLSVYPSLDYAKSECQQLTTGMALKHRTYSTGFTGGKIIIALHDQSSIDYSHLMTVLAHSLRELGTPFYTGCDLNISCKEMRHLASLTTLHYDLPFGCVLAGFGSKCDPNVSTGIGVAASVRRCAESMRPNGECLTILVLGVGKVGSVVSSYLSREVYFNVLVYDVLPGLAKTAAPYATDISEQDWTTVPHDIFVPCAGSHVVSEDTAKRIKCKVVCGASNLPFASEKALEIISKRKIVFVPEAISSAGAVLQDSIERYSPQNFQKLHPFHIYSFVSHLIYKKTEEYLAFLPSNEAPSPYEKAICLSDMGLQRIPIGRKIQKWVFENTMYTDIAIIGAGIAGSACAYFLGAASTDYSISVLEQSSVANKWGSSHGESRMYREMYSDKFYSNLMSKSLEMWKDIEQKAGNRLLCQNGLLFFGSNDTGETVEGSIKGAIQTMKSLCIDFEVFNDADALSQNFPGIQPRANDVGVFCPSDGSVKSSKACQTLTKLAEAKGVSVHENCTVLDIETNPRSTEESVLFLSTGKVMRVKKKLVLTTGAWTSRILKEHYNLHIDACVQMVAWGHFVLPDDAPEMPQWFCFQENSQTFLEMEGNQSGLYYGFPSVKHDGKRLVKVGTDFEPNCTGPNPMFPKSLRAVSKRLREDIISFVQEYWPRVGEMVDMYLSPYHNTPSQDFVLGQLPGFENTFIFCGDSGRAFKFGPLIGACLADLALLGSSKINISRFNPNHVISAQMEGTITRSSPASLHKDEKSNEIQCKQFEVLGKSHVPLGGKGSGLYSLGTQGCFDVVTASEHLVFSALTASLGQMHGCACGQNRTIMLCDFGAADGGTSLNMWTEAILLARKIRPTSEIDMRYEDQPNADYQSLFAYTQGRIRVPGRTKKTYLENISKGAVFVSAIGTSFFMQCVPTNSLSLGFSSTAMHWLSCEPPKQLPPGVLHHTGLSRESDFEIKKVWAETARRDWATILEARAKELKVGGRLVLVNFCIDNQEQFLGETSSVPKSMFAEMRYHWKAMWKDGKISYDEFSKAQLFNYYRSVNEMCGPLQDPTSSVHKSGLRLEHVNTAVTSCPYRSKWLRNKYNASDFAKELTLTMRTWSNSSFENALDSARSQDEKRGICNDLFNRISIAVQNTPNDFGMEYVHAFLVIRKDPTN